MGHPMRIELTRVGLLVYLANHFTTRGAQSLAVVNEHEFSKLESMHAVMAMGFLVWHFLALLWVSLCICLTLWLFESLYFFPYVTIQCFCYVISVPISCSKIVLLPLHPVVDLPACILCRHVSRNFFRYFGRSCFNWNAWLCLGIFLVSCFVYFLWFNSFNCTVRFLFRCFCFLGFFCSFHSTVSLWVFPSFVLSKLDYY